MSVQSGPDEIVAAVDMRAVSIDSSRMSRLRGFLRETHTGSSFRGRVGLTLAVNMALGLIGLATGVVAARLLGPQGRGEMASIQTWPLLLATLASIGQGDALVYFVSRTPRRAGEYLASSLLMVLGTGSLMGLVGWVLMPWLLQAQSAAIINASRVFLLMIGGYAIVGLPHELLRSLGAWRSWNLLRILPGVLWLALLLAAFPFPRIADPIVLSELFLISHLIGLVPLVWALHRQSCGPYVPRADCFGPLLRYGLPSMLNVVPQTLNLRLDQMVMVAFLEPDVLGLYVVAVAWSGILAPLINTVGVVLFPHLSAIDDRRQQRAILIQVARRLAVAIVVVMAAILIATPIGFPLLFGAGFKAAIPSALILVVANGFNALNSTFTASLRGLGRPTSVLVAEIAGLVATLVLLLSLLPRFGIQGAALASLGSYMITTLLLIVQLAWILRRPALDGIAEC